MIAIDHAMTSLEALRAAWRSTAPASEADLTERRAAVHRALWLLALALAVGEDHDAQIGHRVEAFRVHGYLADVAGPYEALVVDDWVYCLIDYPLWATDFAMKEYLRFETRRPTPAAVRGHLPIRHLDRALAAVTDMASVARIWRVTLADLSGVGG